MLGQIGALLCAAAACGIATWRANARGGAYDAGVYRMTARAHRRYAMVFAAFALAFATELVLHSTVAVLVLYTALTLTAVFYATSFARGFTAEDD